MLSSETQQTCLQLEEGWSIHFGNYTCGTGSRKQVNKKGEFLVTKESVELKSFDWFIDTTGASSTLAIDGGSGIVTVSELIVASSSLTLGSKSAGVTLSDDGDGAITFQGHGTNFRHIS